MKDFIVVTGASQNHFNSLKQFLRTVNLHAIDCFVFNLGLDEASVSELHAFAGIHLREFDYSKYPAYYNIHVNAGEYAWKPAIIKLVKDELESGRNISDNTVLLWCDSGDKLPMNTQYIYNYIRDNKIFSPSSSGDIRLWTHPKTLEFFSISSSDNILTNTNRNGAILGFALGDARVRTFIDTIDSHAAIKECIAPEGSNRSNHRQDQAMFTILYYRFIHDNSLPKCTDEYLGIRIHCDID